MLDGLDKIDWGSVRHFKGPAVDVPGLLLNLLSPDKKTQSAAIHDLFDRIWRHGKVYEATSKAVPFLYAVLGNPACCERFSILWLLGAIANGSSPIPDPHSENKNEEIDAARWSENARRAVRQGVPRVLGLLGEADQDLRLPAVLLLASLPEEAAQITPVLSDLLSRETNAQSRAGLGLALALLGDFHGEAFRSENTKLPLAAMETAAKACAREKAMRASAHRMIEDCLLATAGQPDQDWLRDEKKLLESINLN
jgi:hypothetical protein